MKCVARYRVVDLNALIDMVEFLLYLYSESVMSNDMYADFQVKSNAIFTFWLKSVVESH